MRMHNPRWILFLLLFVASRAQAGVGQVEGGTQFSYTDASATSLAVAGSFNDWNTTASPMSDEDGDGTWTLVMKLSPGTYEYKFVVNGGTWVADPDNPRTGGDYGNSLLEVGKGGTVVSGGAPVVASGTPVVSNTPLHSRVHIGGFFRMIMEGADDQLGDDRLRLGRPDDQFNLDVTANLSPKLWGSARLQLLTGIGGPNEIQTELYKAQSSFVDDDFEVLAYYNEEAFATDDPFELLGHGDLRGTIAEEHRPFGQGTQGIVLRMEPFGGQLALMYSDTFDDDLFNPNEPSLLGDGGVIQKEGLNQYTGTDVAGLRYTREFGKARLGLSYRGQYSDWWVNFTSDVNDYPTQLEEHRANQDRVQDQDRSDNFEIANDTHDGALDLSYPLRDDLQLRGAVGYSNYDARWDLGNHEEVQGTGFVNGPVDFPIGDETGFRGELELSHRHGGLRATLSQEIQSFEGMDADENFVSYRTAPASVVEDRDVFAESGVETVYQDINGTDALDILVLGPRPERTSLITELDLAYDYKELTAELEIDRTADDWKYASFAGGEARDVKRFAWRYSPRVTVRPFDSPEHFIAVESEFLRFEDPGSLGQISAEAALAPQPGQSSGSLLRLESTELILRGLLPIRRLAGENLSLAFDLRVIDYSGSEGLSRTEQDSNGDDFVVPLDLTDNFLSAFAALVWKPADAVQVHVGYGVDPTFYNVLSAEGWPNGRQQFRDNYLVDRRLDPYHPLNILAAERALEDQRQFVINAFVRF